MIRFISEISVAIVLIITSIGATNVEDRSLRIISVGGVAPSPTYEAPWAPSPFAYDDEPAPTPKPTKPPTKRPTKKPTKLKAKKRPKSGSSNICPKSLRRSGKRCKTSVQCNFGTRTECCGSVYYSRRCSCKSGGRIRCAHVRPNCSRCQPSKPKPKPTTGTIDRCPPTFLAQSEANNLRCNASFRCNYGLKSTCCNGAVYHPFKCTCFSNNRLRCSLSFVPESVNRGRCKCTTDDPTATRRSLRNQDEQNRMTPMHVLDEEIFDTANEQVAQEP